VTNLVAVLSAAISRMGGDAGFGTGVPHDWQFKTRSWLPGIFSGRDGHSAGRSVARSLRSSVASRDARSFRTSYAAGVRVGYLVAPNVVSTFMVFWSEWSGTEMSNPLAPGGPTGLHTRASFHRNLVSWARVGGRQGGWAGGGLRLFRRREGISGAYMTVSSGRWGCDLRERWSLQSEADAVLAWS